MGAMVAWFDSVLTGVNNIIWHDSVLLVVLAIGVLFTIWSGFCQYHALTHGTAVIFGRYDRADAPGAIRPFQALSAALSGTVGLGNIAGVAVAISLGGPGAVFWMWIVGFVGMALKTAEVTLTMLYRRMDDPQNPNGGTMWVARDGFARRGWPKFGAIVGGVFCVTLLISAITGGNMFQAWNVGVVTETYFRIPQPVVGVILTLLVGAVILGGIQRIGIVTGALTPFMCGLYMVAAIYVVLREIDRVPETLWLVLKSAVQPAQAERAFLGGSVGYAFLWGMKRALFSNEAGQGSSPIAHAAAKTEEPVREGVVAGLEPFIDTLVVCTLTTLVVLLSGAWNRGPEAHFTGTLQLVQDDAGLWTLPPTDVPAKAIESSRINGDWKAIDTVFVLIRAGHDANTGHNLTRLTGTISTKETGGLQIEWTPIRTPERPELVAEPEGHIGLYNDLVGAALTGHAFDRITPGLGTWIVTIATWLFAVSTIISWSYYGEQGMLYLLGPKSVLPYRVIYCLAILVACSGYIRTDAELDNLTALGTGVMLWANLPILLLFGTETMFEYRSYLRRMREQSADRGDQHG